MAGQHAALWQLGSLYEVQEEVLVGKKPLQIDLLLLHREQGELPATVRRVLAGLVEYLGEFTLVEFKSPSDTLRAGDFQTFLSYAMLYRAQNDALLAPERLHLLVLAPRLTKPYREELRVLGVIARQQGAGVWCLHGGLVIHPTWVLETEELAGLSHPLLTLFSPRFLADAAGTYDALQQGGYTEIVTYLAQQIHLFRQLGKEFAMQHLGSEELQRVWRKILAETPPEERLEDLTAEERLKGLSPEERLKGLSPEELERLRQLLQTQAKMNGTSPPESKSS